MDFTKFQPKNGERYIFMENGQPVAVLLSFEDYEKNLRQGKKDLVGDEAKALSSPSLLFRKSSAGDEAKASSSPSPSLRESSVKELGVEDLPF